MQGVLVGKKFKMLLYSGHFLIFREIIVKRKITDLYEYFLYIRKLHIKLLWLSTMYILFVF